MIGVAVGLILPGAELILLGVELILLGVAVRP
jgi:hypothetical protein